ncbi:MFS transporter [Arthrobacter sp. NPDC090010]|uniref:MFS transporter n=1 Tax=Arthrobacter sp. NPDC090010 TaxID=3363942 RepID=UPI0037F9D4E8
MLNTPETRKPRLPFEVWALVAGGFTVALGYGVVAPVIPQFALEFGVSNFAASAIVSAFALMRLVSAPLAGWVIGRFGEQRTYIAGILIVALSTGAASLAVDYTQFVVLRGAGGVGSAMFTIAATALLIKVSPPDARARVASLNAAGFLLGGLLGPVFGGLVTTFGLRAPFVFYFLTLIAAAIVVTVALRSSRRTASLTQPVEDTPQLSFGLALGIRQYRTLLLSVFSFGWASFGIRVSVLPLFVVVALHGSPATAAWVLAAYAAGNALLIFPAGRWGDTLGRKPLLVIGMAALTVAYLLVPATPVLWTTLLVMLVAGAGSALVNPAQQAVLADVLAQRRGGNVVAAYSMASDLGGVLGPLVAGAVVDAAGFGWAFGITAALLGAATLAWLLVPDSRGLSHPAPLRHSTDDDGVQPR